MTVVRLGALADYVPDAEGAEIDRRPVDDAPGVSNSVSFSVEQFAVLSDGRRLVLDDRRGFAVVTQGYGDSTEPVDAWQVVTRELVEEQVRNALLPDDDLSDEELSWPSLVERFREHGIATTSEQLLRLPYEIVLSERLLARISSEGRRGDAGG